jgi:hypothetical protein
MERGFTVEFMTIYRFQSTLFEIEPGEDEEINPRMYGKQFAAWLKSQLEARGYDIEPIIAEDWGRCLMCAREPFLLWVGCANETDYATAQPNDPPPAKEDVVWVCSAEAEVSLWKRLFKRPDASAALARLDDHLKRILEDEPAITLLAIEPSSHS